jgi:hypothetical protein
MMGGANKITTAPEEGFRSRREAGCRYSVHSARYHGDDVDDENLFEVALQLAGRRRAVLYLPFHPI